MSKVNVKSGRLLVETRDGGKQSVEITEKTRIERNRKPAKLSELKPGDRIVIKYQPRESGPATATSILARGK